MLLLFRNDHTHEQEIPTILHRLREWISYKFPKCDRYGALLVLIYVQIFQMIFFSIFSFYIFIFSIFMNGYKMKFIFFCVVSAKRLSFNIAQFALVQKSAGVFVAFYHVFPQIFLEIPKDRTELILYT